MIRFGEIERYVGNLMVYNLLCCDLGVRGDLSTPAKPDAGFLLKCGPDGNFQPAGARGRIFVRDSDSVRDYDKLSQKVTFPQRFARTPPNQMEDSTQCSTFARSQYAGRTTRGPRPGACFIAKGPPQAEARLRPIRGGARQSISRQPAHVA